MTVINTACMIIMVVTAAVFMTAHRKGTFVIDRDKKIPEAKARQANRDSALLFTLKIVTITIASSSATLFFVTENMDDNAPLTNPYTFIHCILFVVFLVIVSIGYKETGRVDKVLREQKPKEDKFFLD